jgi:subtilisin family serine protease
VLSYFISFVRLLPQRAFLLLSLIFLAVPAHAEAPQRVAGQYLIKFAPAMRSGTARSAARTNLGVKVLQTHPLTGAQLVETDAGKAFDDEYAKNLLASGAVDYIEPNYIVSANGAPNDSRYSALWGLNNTGQTGGTADIDIDAPEAWDLSTGNPEVVVGVVDTGVDYNHEDLAANMWHNPGEIPGNGIDDDGDGVVDDVYGYNAINPAAPPLDDNGHGSHCSGTIGGVGNNSRGVVGVNWNVKIMALKFLDSSGSGSTSDAISAIEYAVAMKNRGVNIKVLSNSWGGGGYSQALQDAIAAAENAGILFVAAAGNDASDNDAVPAYPANYQLDNIISVAAIDHNGNLASFSNFGASSVDLAAPGVGIISSIPNNQYASYSGTSMATPHVSGVAALLAGREPNLTPSQLKTRLLNTVKPLSSLNGQMRSPGIVDAYNALSNIESPLPPAPPRSQYRKSSGTAAYDSNLGQRILTSDDGYSTQNLSFHFPFYGSSYARISVSANGRVVPLADGESDPTGIDYSNKLTNGIYILNDDLFPSSAADGGVWFKADGSSAVITWVVVTYAQRNAVTSATEMRFQMKLFANGRIEFHYLDTDTGDPDYDYGRSASVGLAPMGSGEKLLVSHNAADQSDIGNGKLLRFDPKSHKTVSDFDGDGISDLIVWRPASGYWYILTSSSGFDFSQHQAYQLGLPGDIPLTGDFDGDGRTDLAVWRPSDGMWYFRTSGSNYGTISSLQWGLPGDTPLSADYDGDGISDIAVFRPDAGFYVLRSSSGFNRSAALLGSDQSLMTVSFPGAGNDPVTGDFDGDGADDFVTVWQLIRFWSLKNHSGQLLSSLPWGEPGDTPLGCDWDNNGTSDRIAVRVNPNLTLDWFAASDSGPVYTANFGSLGDVPSCSADYDGDGKMDLRVFRRTTGEWFIKQSTDNSVRAISFGLPGDIAL